MEHALASPSARTSESYFPCLTGIRAIAASMVFLHHFNPFKEAIFGQSFHGFVGEFHVGVNIFFVLSGFLICHRYYDTLSSKKFWLWNYFVNRFARIYPMYFIVTVVLFLPIVCHCSFGDNIKVFLLNITFLRGLFDEYKFTGAAGGWSLTVEEMFYFLFPLIILVSRTIKLAIQPLIFIALGLLLWIIFKNIPFHGFFSTLKFLFNFTFFGRCLEFYAGILLALYIRRQGVLSVRRGCYLTVGGVIWIAVCIFCLALNFRYSRDPGTLLLFKLLLNNILLSPGIALFFYGLLTEKSLIRKLLESRLLILLGKSSYVFYLIHNGPLFNAFYFAVHEKLEIVYILMQLTAVILFVLVEKPLNTFIRRKWLYPPSPPVLKPA